MALQFLNNAIGTSATFTGVFTMTDRLVLSDSSNNSFIGEDAGVNNTTGDNNVSLGHNSLFSNTTGAHNNAIGAGSLYSNISGNHNIAIGEESLYSTTTGNNNIGIGFKSLYTNLTGYSNVGLGQRSLEKNTTGVGNIAIGTQALWNNTTGGSNVALGSSSLVSNTTGAANVAFGVQSLVSNTTGNYNVAMGYQAGKFAADGTTANATGSKSIFIGQSSKANADGETNQIVIGDIAIGNGSNTVTLGNDSIVKTVLKGTITAPSYGAGTLVTDASGNITAATSGPGTGTVTGTGTTGVLTKFTDGANGVIGDSILAVTADSLDFTNADFAQIKFKESGAITIDSDDDQSSRNFAIKDGSGTNLLVIQDTGNATFAGTLQVDGSNLGIGGAPANASYGSVGTKLDLKGGADSIILLRGAAGGSGAGAYAASEYGLYAYNGEFLLTRTNQNGWWASPDFKLSGGNATFAGNVGIGTTSPAQLLDVNGIADINSIIIGTNGDNIYHNDSDFYIKTETAHALIFRTSNVNRLTIASDGNVSINGTSNSAGDTNNGVPKLQVNTTTAALGEFPLAARFTTNSDAGDNSGVSVLINSGNDRGLMISAGRQTGNVSKVTLNVVDNAGDEIDTITLLQNGSSGSSANVGIGTPSPEYGLSVLTNDGGGVGNIVAYDNAPQAAGVGGGIGFGGYYNTTSITPWAIIRAPKDNSTNGNFAGALTFSTRNSSSFNEAMRITSNGNVGIGTTSPSAKLEVNVGINSLKISGRDTYIDSSIDSANANIYVTQAGAGDFGQLAGSLVLQARTQGTVYRDIIFAGGLTSGDALMTIQGEGNVGIGTTSPAGALSVSNGGANGLEIDPQATITEILSYNRSTSAYTDLYLYAKDIILGPQSGGNVGIGTTSPTYPLDVSGTARATNFISGNSSSNDSLVLASENQHEKVWTTTCTFTDTGAGIYYFNLAFGGSGGFGFDLELVTTRNGNYRNFGKIKDSSYMYWETDGDFAHHAQGPLDVTSDYSGGEVSLNAIPTAYLSATKTATSYNGSSPWSYFIKRYAINLTANLTGSDGVFKVLLKTTGFTGTEIRFLNQQ